MPKDSDTYGQNEFLHSDFDLDPILVAEGWPNEMGFGDCVLIRVQDDLGLLVVDVKSTKK